MNKLHVALLGDSVFDNESYTGGAPPVAHHLRSYLSLLPGKQHDVTLLAVDGATTETFDPQYDGLAEDMTHYVLSLGGNDALGCLDLFQRQGEGVRVFAELGKRVAGFRDRYQGIVDALLQAERPLLLCTIYHGHFDLPLMNDAVRGALPAFNEVITDSARLFKLPLLDLRGVLAKEDYVQSVEPGHKGSRKIGKAVAEAIADMVIPESPVRS